MNCVPSNIPYIIPPEFDENRITVRNVFSLRPAIISATISFTILVLLLFSKIFNPGQIQPVPNLPTLNIQFEDWLSQYGDYVIVANEQNRQLLNQT